MVRLFLLSVFVLGCVKGFSQSFELPNNFVTAKQGFALSLKPEQALYLNLELEYYTTPKWSLISGTHVFLTQKKTLPNKVFNTETFLGANYHFFIKNIDFYVGAQPGYNLISEIENKNNYSVSPLISLAAGINYYSSKYFHLFIQGRYVFNNQFSDFTTQKHDVRIAFGLGYNFTQIYQAIFNKKSPQE